MIKVLRAIRELQGSRNTNSRITSPSEMECGVNVTEGRLETGEGSSGNKR